MKDLLVSTRPSYQHLLMKLSRAPLRRSTFWFLAESEKSEALLAFSCPLAATPPSASLDQNKLKKALWTLSVFNLSLPLVLTLSLPFVSHSPPVFFLSCSGSPKKCIYKKKTTNLSRQLFIDIHTSQLPSTLLQTSVCLYLSSSPPSSLCLPVSHSHPASLFVPLSTAGVNVLFPDCPHCPLTLSVPQRIRLVAMVTSLPPCWETSLC